MSSKAAHFRFKTLIGYVTPYRSKLLVVVALMLGVSLVSLASPWLAGQVTANLFGEADSGAIPIASLLWLWLGLLALQALLSFGNSYIGGSVTQKILIGLRTRLYDHLQSLPLSYFHDRRKGEILALLTNDATILSNFVTGTLLALLPQLLTLCGALLFVFLIDPLIAVIFAAVIPLFYLVMKIVGRNIRPVSRAMIDAYANTFSIVEENLNVLPVIKAFSRESLESGRVEEGSQRLLDLTRRYLLIQSMISPLVQFLAAGGILLLVAMATSRVQTGDMTAAELVSLLLYGMLLTRPVSGLANVYGQIQHTRGAAERLVNAFAIEPEPDDVGKKLLPPLHSDIEFRNVHFSYSGRGNLLSGLNLRIRAGETLAVTGVNGSGKSTLAHMLMRFIEPTAGQVLIDGEDISQVTLSSLRNQVGLVQQHVLLINGSISENIAFGSPHASDSEVVNAARKAHALGFIEALPEGFDTQIGDQGVRLSGGQKQRLSLARALLKQPPILILDEATAMFDPAGEESFIEEAHEMLKNCTVILITHRPASLKLADRIVEIRDGIAVEVK